MIKVYIIEKRTSDGRWIPYEDRVFVKPKQTFVSKTTAQSTIDTICSISKVNNSQFRLKEKQVSCIKFDEI